MNEFAVFLSTSSMHSMTYHSRNLILSQSDISLFFTLACFPVTICIPYSKRAPKNHDEIYLLSAKSFAQFLYHISIPYIRIPIIHSSFYKAKDYDSPTVIAGEMQFKAVNPTIAPFPSVTVPLKTFLAYHL